MNRDDGEPKHEDAEWVCGIPIADLDSTNRDMLWMIVPDGGMGVSRFAKEIQNGR